MGARSEEARRPAPTPTFPPPTPRGVSEHHHPGGSYATLKLARRGKRTSALAIVGELESRHQDGLCVQI